MHSELGGEFERDLVGAETLDGGAEGLKFAVDVFVAAVEVVDALDDGLSFSCEACEDEGSAGTEVGGHDWGAVEFFDAVDDGAGALDGDLSAHAFEFGDVHEAVWINAFGDDAEAWGEGHEGGDLGLEVGGEAWEGKSDDFFGFKGFWVALDVDIVIGVNFDIGFFELV